MDLDYNPAITPAAPVRKPLNAAAFTEFLKSGWFLSVPSRGNSQVLVGWGALTAHEDSPVTDSGQAALFAPDFRLKTTRPWITTPAWDLVDREVFTKLAAALPAYDSDDLNWQEPPRELFDERFREIHSRMKTDGLDKAVPVVFATAEGDVSQTRRLDILQNLAGIPAHLIAYGFWGELDSCPQGMMGVTPEVLFSLVDDTLETAALAATRAKNQTTSVEFEAQALLDDTKERSEHQFVVEDIKSVLKQVGSVEIGSTGVLELPTLFHLKTAIRAKLHAPLSLDRAAQLLHPTPALGFAPRGLGMNEMDHWDNGDYRWRYGAPFGVDAALSSSERLQECVVAIRNIQWRDDSVRLGSGCGVVRASVADREWSELRLKRDSVKRLLGV